MRKVLVTGGAGFIGQRTCRALLERGYEVRVLDQLMAPVHPNRDWPASLQHTECIVGDVRSRDDWQAALENVWGVVHLAAYQDYLPDFSNFITSNSAATALLYELIVAKHLPIERIVIASSQAVYGEGRYSCAEHGEQYPNARSNSQLKSGNWEIRCQHCRQVLTSMPTDESRTNPQNAYGISKLGQEMIGLQLGRRYGIPTVALRYSITQGAGQSIFNAYSGICRIFTICALQGEPMPIFEDGQQRRDYIYVDDVVAANIVALEDPRTDYQVFNVGGEDAMTVLQYAHLVAKVVGAEPILNLGSRFRVGDTRHVVSDSGRLCRLGWRRRKGVPQIVSEYVHWIAGQRLPERLPQNAMEQMLNLGALQTARSG